MRLPAQNPPAAKRNISVKAPAGVTPSYFTCDAKCAASLALCAASQNHGDNPLDCHKIYDACMAHC